MSNRLKGMRDPTFIYTLLENYFKEAFMELFMCPWTREAF
jgi:hypothetical protein